MRVPIGIKNDDSISTRQIDSQPSGSGTQEEAQLLSTGSYKIQSSENKQKFC